MEQPLKKDLKWVYGTRTEKWHLVDHTFYDYESGISPEDFGKMSPEQAQEIYLSPIKL